MKRRAVLLAIAWWIPVKLAAQTPAANPWQRVPALTTSCRPDEFPQVVSALHETMKGELATLKDANEKVKDRFNSMDAGERMSRLQAYMMKNPQEAAKVAEAMAGSTRAQATNIMSADADKTAMQEQFKALEKEFRGAMDASTKPFKEKQGQMISAKSQPYAGGYRFTSKADQDAYMDLLKQEDAAYDKACVPYFGVGGKFPTWLTEYRTKVAAKVAEATDASDSDLITNLKMFDISGFRATGQLTAVLDYLEKLGVVYAVRYSYASPPTDLIRIK